LVAAVASGHPAAQAGSCAAANLTSPIRSGGPGAAAQQRGIGQGIEATEAATQQALGFLDPLQQVGQQGIEQAGFLTDPQAQFDFLQQNPLFQMSLDQAQTQTQNLAAARGRLSAGDTLQQLSQNVLLSAQPLIAQQKGSISDLLNLSSGTATAQANTAIGQGSNLTNLLTSSGDVGAAGIVSSANIAGDRRRAQTESLASIAPYAVNALSGQT